MGGSGPASGRRSVAGAVLLSSVLVPGLIAVMAGPPSHAQPEMKKADEPVTEVAPLVVRPDGAQDDPNVLVSPIPVKPGTSSCITRIAVPREYQDLRLSDVHSARVNAGGREMLRVTGAIYNPRKSKISIPPLLIAIVDDSGQAVRLEQAEAKGQPRIPAGGHINFIFDFAGFPDDARKTVVTFASPDKTASYCGYSPRGMPNLVAATPPPQTARYGQMREQPFGFDPYARAPRP